MLLGGLANRRCYDFVVLFSAFHAILFLALFRFQLRPFPAQVRIGYLLWVAVGSYVPYLLFLMHITTIGLAGNLFSSIARWPGCCTFAPGIATNH